VTGAHPLGNTGGRASTGAISYQGPTVLLPGGEFVLARKSQADGIDTCFQRCDTVIAVTIACVALDLPFEETLVELGVVGLVETCRETKIGQLDMSFAVNKNVVWLDISVVHDFGKDRK
jgi:hypothetical protein